MNRIGCAVAFLVAFAPAPGAAETGDVSADGDVAPYLIFRRAHECNRFAVSYWEISKRARD